MQDGSSTEKLAKSMQKSVVVCTHDFDEKVCMQNICNYVCTEAWNIVRIVDVVFCFSGGYFCRFFIANFLLHIKNDNKLKIV